MFNWFKLFFLFIVTTFPLCAQDERTFRDLYLFSDRKKKRSQAVKEYLLKVRSNRYFIDLTEDDKQESFYYARRDGESWVHFFDSDGKEFLQSEFHTNGPWSRLFKVQLRKLSKSTKVLLLYFYEGMTKYSEFKGTSRVYFMTLDKNDLKTASIYKGPILFDEFREARSHYHQRKYEISLFDLDGDYVREISVKYGRMSKVYKYYGKGTWRTLDDNDISNFDL